MACMCVARVCDGAGTQPPKDGSLIGKRAVFLFTNTAR
jgi:hypothetical protein